MRSSSPQVSQQQQQRIWVRGRKGTGRDRSQPKLYKRLMHFVGQFSTVGRVVFLSLVFVLLCYRSIAVNWSEGEEGERQVTFEAQQQQQQQQQFGSLARVTIPMAMGGVIKQTTFAAGCFWSVELAFQRVPGVVKTAVGYTQGHVENPTYEQVCSGRTGHVEAVLIDYNVSDVSFQQLLDVFWKKHDPTQKNRQGNDVGTQYRSGIYYHTSEQEGIAKASLKAMEEKLGRKIATEVLPAKTFYMAEDYHQQYLEKGVSGGGKQSARKMCNDPIRCYG